MFAKRIKESKDDFTKKKLKRLKRVKDIIKHEGRQKSTRIKEMRKMAVLRKTFNFSTTHKVYLIF